jgi:hypothetical protein
MKNFTKPLSYFFFLLMLGFVACNSSSTIDPANSIIGKWRQTTVTSIPAPTASVQKAIDNNIICNKNVVYEFTSTDYISSGITCNGVDTKSTSPYTLSNGKLTFYNTTFDVTISGNQLTWTGVDNGITGITTFTRL